VVRARLIIVSGVGEGVFIYNGVPGLGNPPIVSMTSGSVDPYGNPVVPGLDVTEGSITGTTISGSTINGSTFTGTDFVINSAGAFFYSGTPAAGNLIASIAAAAGTDSHTNTYPAGITSYNNAGAKPYVNLFEGQILFQSRSPASFAAGVVIDQGQGTLSAQSSSTASGDTPASIILQSKDESEDGTAPELVIGQRTQAQGPINAENPSSPANDEVWHSLGTPAAGWTNNQIAEYKLLADAGGVAIRIRDLSPPGAKPADGSVVWTAANGLPAAWAPVAGTRAVCYSNNIGTETPVLEFESDGSIEVYGIGGTTCTRLDCYVTLYTF
jgi:hypothetical protein